MNWRRHSLAVTIALCSLGVGGTLIYVGIAHGWFESKVVYKLTAVRASGVRAGIGVEYAGFEIGRVSKVSLNHQGVLEIAIQLAQENQQWVRSDSVFSLEQPLLGAPRIVVESGDRRGPILPAGSLRPLRTEKQLDLLMARGTGLIDDVRALVNSLGKSDGAFQQSLGHVEVVSGRMARDGALRGALDDKTARSVDAALAGSVRVIEQLDQTLVAVREMTREAGQLAKGADRAVQDVTRRIAGQGGSADKVDAVLEVTVKALNDMRTNLAELDRTLANATRISTDVAKSSGGIDQFRARLDAIARNVDEMTQDLRRLGLFRRAQGNDLP